MLILGWLAVGPSKVQLYVCSSGTVTGPYSSASTSCLQMDARDDGPSRPYGGATDWDASMATSSSCAAASAAFHAAPSAVDYTSMLATSSMSYGALESVCDGGVTAYLWGAVPWLFTADRDRQEDAIFRSQVRHSAMICHSGFGGVDDDEFGPLGSHARRWRRRGMACATSIAVVCAMLVAVAVARASSTSWQASPVRPVVERWHRDGSGSSLAVADEVGARGDARVVVTRRSRAEAASRAYPELGTELLDDDWPPHPIEPTYAPSAPSYAPTPTPSAPPSRNPIPNPSPAPTVPPPSSMPAPAPSAAPIPHPSETPSRFPVSHPTSQPVTHQTAAPLPHPTPRPSYTPTLLPTPTPIAAPTYRPSNAPTWPPSTEPTTASPSAMPLPAPTVRPSFQFRPSAAPTNAPTAAPCNIVTVRSAFVLGEVRFGVVGTVVRSTL